MTILPQVVSVRVNSGRKVLGSFIDAEWVLHYIAAGTWTFRFDNIRHEVRLGDMVLLPPRLLHVVQPISRGRLVQYVVHFHLPTSMRQGQFARVVRIPSDVRKEIKTLFQRLTLESASNLSQGKIVMGGFLSVMLGIYFRYATRKKPAGEDDLPGWKYIEAAIQCLHHRYKKPDLSLTEIAAASSLSPNYLCRLFKASTGLPVKLYLTHFRLQKAEELLLQSRLNCSEIAEAVGFSGIHLFSRTFSRSRGDSPTTFRKRYAPRLPIRE